MLKVNDFIEIKQGHTVNVSLPKHFFGKPGDFSYDRQIITIDKAISFLEGIYVVTQTAEDGGSSGYDTYPDGHHVWCVNIDDVSKEIDFYESGCFIHTIEDIKPIDIDFVQSAKKRLKISLHQTLPKIIADFEGIPEVCEIVELLDKIKKKAQKL